MCTLIHWWQSRAHLGFDARFRSWIRGIYCLVFRSLRNTRWVNLVAQAGILGMTNNNRPTGQKTSENGSPVPGKWTCFNVWPVCDSHKYRRFEWRNSWFGNSLGNASIHLAEWFVRSVLCNVPSNNFLSIANLIFGFAKRFAATQLTVANACLNGWK